MIFRANSAGPSENKEARIFNLSKVNKDDNYDKIVRNTISAVFLKEFTNEPLFESDSRVP